ncbi:MAG: Ig domain-containing protein [Ruminococcus sp.]
MKKTLSVFLAVLMAMSIITIAGTTASALEVAKVNGVECSVGNTVTFAYHLKTPGKFEDFQGSLSYSSGLKILDLNMSESKGVMSNINEAGTAYYNGTSYQDPYDYTFGSDESLDTLDSLFFTASFEVVAGGEQTITNNMYIITGVDGTDYYEYGVNKGCKEKADVTVEPYPATSIILDKKSATVNAGSKLTLRATVTPELAAMSSVVEWTSSNTSVATVANGVVTAKKAGTATITATVGELKATCKVTVVQKVTSIKVSNKSVYTGKQAKLSVKVYPTNASNKKVSYSSGNKAVATVTSAGVVKGIKPGKATITVKALDGSGKYGKCTVTVLQQKAKSVKLSSTKATIAKAGKSVKVKATLTPSNVYNKSINVKSDNTKIVKVKTAKIKSGNYATLKGVKKGTAKVKFTAADGSKKSATCKVTVKK